MYRVNNAVNPREVPIATRTIAATEEITKDDIEIVEIGSSFLSNADVYTSANDLVGKYVNTGTSIPSFLANSQIAFDVLTPSATEPSSDKMSSIFLPFASIEPTV